MVKIEKVESLGKISRNPSCRIADTAAKEGIIIYRGKEVYPIASTIRVMGLYQFI